MFEIAMPLPALPATSLTWLASSVITLLASVIAAVGVSVAVQVLPPSLLTRLDNTPLATLRSERLRPLTTSLKVMVTVVVWPMPSVPPATEMVAVGRWVSIT